jgi:hypothetical protein
MGDYQHEIQLQAVKSSGPPMDAFIRIDILINPNGYDINPILLDLLQFKMFAGDDTEDPYGHVEYFEDVCGTFNLNIFTEDEVKFKLFGQTLTNRARAWYNDYPILNSCDWKAMSTKFLQIFFPETRSVGARRVITNFKSLPHVSIYESYSRFREILNNCPHHDFPPWLIIHTFYAGVNVKIRVVLDLLTDGSFTQYGVDRA